MGEAPTAPRLVWEGANGLLTFCIRCTLKRLCFGRRVKRNVGFGSAPPVSPLCRGPWGTTSRLRAAHGAASGCCRPRKCRKGSNPSSSRQQSHLQVAVGASDPGDGPVRKVTFETVTVCIAQWRLAIHKVVQPSPRTRSETFSPPQTEPVPTSRPPPVWVSPFGTFHVSGGITPRVSPTEPLSSRAVHVVAGVVSPPSVAQSVPWSGRTSPGPSACHCWPL